MIPIKCAFLILLALAFSWQCRSDSVSSLADVSCNSATHALSSSSIEARWVQIIAPETNSNPVRVADSNTGSGRGARIAPGGGYFFPPAPDGYPYLLNQLSYYCLTGDSFTVIYGVL